MATTIQISKELAEELKKRKMFKNDTYEEVIRDLIEDTLELSDETKKAVKEAQKDYKEGKFIPFSKIKKQLKVQ